MRYGKVGDKLKSGQVVLTASGNKTTPFPRLDFSTPRKTCATLARVNNWLYLNAMQEAAARGDRYNLFIFKGENPKKLPQATKDSFEQYLFGKH